MRSRSPWFLSLLALGLTLVISSTQGLRALDEAGDKPSTSEQPSEASSADGGSNSDKSGTEKQKVKVVDSPKEYNKLNAEEERVILRKGTERAFIGEYTDNEEAGTYICRRCNAALYQSDSKFHSGCGWPSFDDEVKGAVTRLPDIDGLRTEIICSNCKGHLGHVFFGERFTDKNTRHCVNSVSMKFVPSGKPLPPKIVLKKNADKSDD